MDEITVYNRKEVFNYHGHGITFSMDNGDVMVNLTEMAKPFGKLPAHFLSNEQTKSYIQVLKESLTIGIPIVTTVEGKYGGTWAHQKLALKFAAWLNPRFELWIFDRIEELLRHGYTKLDSIGRKELALMLLQAEEEKEKAMQIAMEQERELKSQAPKVKYHDAVLQSESLINTNVIAKELGMSAYALNKRLHAMGIIYKSGNTWVLYQRYADKGLTGTRTVPYIDREGNQKTTIHTYWTEAGRKFIHSRLASAASFQKV